MILRPRSSKALRHLKGTSFLVRSNNGATIVLKFGTKFRSYEASDHSHVSRNRPVNNGCNFGGVRLHSGG